MRGPRRTLLALGCALALGLLLPAIALAQPPGGGAVGIRLSVNNVDPDLLSADLDLTAYTRGYGPYTYTGGTFYAIAGTPYFGYPAIDYGDGSTLSYATLALTNSGGGPGGSNVFRSLASFSHTYPTAGSYTARAAIACFLCFQTQYAFFPPGSPAPPTFTYSANLLPDTVIGSLPLVLSYAGTTFSSFLSTSVRYAFQYYPVVTASSQIDLASAIPTASEWGLILLGLALVTGGLFVLRRS